MNTAYELGEALGQFIKSLEGLPGEEAQKRIEKAKRYMKALDDLPEEDVKYLSKDPEKLMFDLEAISRGNGTWEKIKMFRDMAS